MEERQSMLPLQLADAMHQKPPLYVVNMDTNKLSNGEPSSTQSSVKLLNLSSWCSMRYSAGCEPHPVTVRRWIKEEKISPLPIKQGRAYYFHPDAVFTDSGSNQKNSNHDEIP